MNTFSKPYDLWSQITDDITLAILVRVSAHPWSVARLSAVCKTWRMLVRSSKFRAMMMEHHGAAPLIGWFINNTMPERFIPTGNELALVGTGRFRLPTTSLEASSCSIRWEVLGCRHGKVLLLAGATQSLLVWDPITRQQTQTYTPFYEKYNQGAVICEVNHGHGHCHASPWYVVWVASSPTRTNAMKFRSSTGRWENTWTHSMVDFRPSMFIAQFIIWHQTTNHLTVYDTESEILHSIEGPDEAAQMHRRNVHVVRLDGNVIGRAALSSNSLRIWTRVGGVEAGSTWELSASIPWISILPFNFSTSAGQRLECRIVCVFEDRNIMLIRTTDGVFEVNYSTRSSVSRMGEHFRMTMFPYSSYYIAGAGDEIGI